MKVRQSNFELLRIITMILIVAHHYSIYGCVLSQQTSLINRYVIQVLASGGKLGVNLFVLISGYFFVNAKFDIKKITRFVLEVTSYSIIIMFIYLFSIKQIDIKFILTSLFPIFYNKWWFASIYFSLYLFSPAINTFIHSCSKKKLDLTIFLMITLGSIIPTFLVYSTTYSFLFLFVMLYLIGARIKLYPLSIKVTSKSLLIALIISICNLLFMLMVDLVSAKFNVSLYHYYGYFNDMYKLPTVLIAVFAFIGFSNLKIQNNFINKVASTTFGIYLIHDHNVVRSVLWKKLLQTIAYTNSPLLIPHAIISIILVFVVCSILVGVFNKTIGALIDLLMKKYGYVIDKKFNAFIDYFDLVLKE